MKKKLIATLAALFMVGTCAVAAGCELGGTTSGDGTSASVDYNTVIPEGSFSLLSPVANATDVATTPAIAWSSEPNATSYHVEIATDAAFTSVVRETTTEALDWTVSNALTHSTTYYFRVTALKEDGTIALARKSAQFTTVAEHATETPDYTKTRTVYDFEDFADTAALNAEFSMHVAGDPVGVSLSENGGVNGSKAMRIDYTHGDNGWAGALASLSAEKKVWSGAKGIRMWVSGDASGMEVEVRFGKRGYQSWSASFNVNASGGKYVTIPFSAFEDAGGGDGILDLSGITRLWFFFKGNGNSTIYIDDVTIGSDAEHSTDTRGEIETAAYAPIGLYADFENYADEAALTADGWVSESMSSVSVTSDGINGTKSVALVPTSAWATFGRNISYTDFSNVTSMSFRASKGTYTVQVISEYNVIEANITASRDGELTGLNLADLKPQSSAHTYKVDQINCVRIGIHSQVGNTVLLDDWTFGDQAFVPENSVAKAGVLEDFESYTDTAAMNKVWSTESIAASLATENALGGDQSASLVPSAGWSTFSINLGTTDFSDIKALSFKASAGVYCVQMLQEWNKLEKDGITVSEDGGELRLNLSELTGNASLSAIDTIVIGVKNKNGSTVLIDDLTLYAEEFTAETPDPEQPVEPDEPDDPETVVGFEEDFEGENYAIADHLTIAGNATPSIATDGGNSWLSVVSNGAFGMQFAASYFTNADFANAAGLKFDITVNESVADLEIKIGSYANLYVYHKQFYGATNNIASVVVDFASMKLADDGVSYGELNKANINFLQIYVTCYGSGYTLTLDNIGFYTADTDLNNEVLIDDFSSYTTDAELQAAWNASNVTLSDGAMLLTGGGSGWDGTQFNFTSSGTIGAADDYQNCYAIRLTVTASSAFNLCVKLTRWSNSMETYVYVAEGTSTITVYFSDLTGNAWSDCSFNSLTLGAQYLGTGTVLIDDVAFLRG